MTMTNPFAQAGWFNDEVAPPPRYTYKRLHSERYIPTTSPLFGALPHSPHEASPDFIRFTFDSVDGDILDCSLTGSDDQEIFKITTNRYADGLTSTNFIKNGDNIFARIEWTTPPFVKIDDSLPRQELHAWIKCTEKSER